MKYNTVLFRDSVNQYYIGTNENGQITAINYLQVPPSHKKKIDEMLSETALNEFLIVEVESGLEHNNIKITPITCCVLTESDSEEEIAPNLCELGHDKLLDIFKKIPKELLEV